MVFIPVYDIWKANKLLLLLQEFNTHNETQTYNEFTASSTQLLPYNHFVKKLMSKHIKYNARTHIAI
jgi:hypothetical protein